VFQRVKVTHAMLCSVLLPSQYQLQGLTMCLTVCRRLQFETPEGLGSVPIQDCLRLSMQQADRR
jgi:hypothetical protein